jgi:hypothetical protein
MAGLYMFYFVSRFVGYRLRNQLAAIDYNHHRGREVATTADGRPRYYCIWYYYTLH